MNFGLLAFLSGPVKYYSGHLKLPVTAPDGPPTSKT